MSFYPTDRLALFIDGANLYSAAKSLGFDIDYRKLLEEFRKRSVLVRAYYYTALVENEEYSPIRPLVDWLDYNGYRLVTKAAREYTDSQGRKRWRGDMDVEIAVDMLEMSGSVDHVVLFSGDGDFRALVEAVQRKGCRVTVVSTVKSQPPMVSDELRRQADTFVDLADLADLIGRPARLPKFIQESNSPRVERDDPPGASRSNPLADAGA
ncbi:NYN domain-containing protein [Phenylobacterium sp. J426]|uniref:LabA-like NYN domain-containing protein n=1 Tax=Phenylobacterium sp. J426 TaxID=2898439 RepID=UPI002150977F|nr:NYN domain-containing protein [Phenylobacterium sp. J426]MCR5875493.1 NYN domain-containing protein [Phenylobacterium sp. J426]